MMIEIEHLTKTLRGRTVLRDICLRLDSGGGGMVVGLRGPNGSGKTMLLRAICGLIVASSGRVTVDGRVLGRDCSFPPSVGALLEHPAFLPEHTGRRNLALLGDIRGGLAPGQLEQAIRQVGLDPEDRRAFRKYSLGMKQRLGIAAAILERPCLLLLDEPFNALDEAGVRQIAGLIRRQREEGRMILLACHDPDELYALADQVVTLRDGQIERVEPLRGAGREGGGAA